MKAALEAIEQATTKEQLQAVYQALLLFKATITQDEYNQITNALHSKLYLL